MSVAALLLGLFAFILVLRVFNAAQVASDVIETTQGAIGMMANTDITDADKEKHMRRASIKLLGRFFWIASIGVMALAASGVLVWGGSLLGLYSLERAIEVALGWPFILGSCIVAIAVWVGLDRMKRTPASEVVERDDVPYNKLDIALHDFAFASPRRQRTLGKLESRIFKRRIDIEQAKRPIFVTSLPRAGTTIMLEVLASLPQFASATYRHMPFTLSPLLWGGFSGAFRKPGEKAERAHGDGIEVGFDSPEAFEEMLWMAFWPEHYGKDRITPWTADAEKPEFETFFRTHMAKIVATKSGAARYLSKNNANIARLGLIQRMFPDACVIVPVRNPRAQVQSLMRQHQRFSDLHAREPFARRYMEGIGHLEFGEALRPIAFDGTPHDPDMANSPAFWLDYWIAAYEHILATAGPSVVIVDHDALCAEPARFLPQLAKAMQLDHQAALTAMGATFRAPGPVPDLTGVTSTQLQRADNLHAELCRLSIGAALSKQGYIS
ncbi:sulfotransferase family protein [Yoonia maricola]|uniref:Sulfotransferase family protein n=1 Tax=Yoonia maricola TaxID=420999 RepID=A0A2M8WKK2_9RHOB|nr:sulfotransferase [Yoonia maricola]PJI91462.1 sulfotransferase family protein [Yoonia maricola]